MSEDIFIGKAPYSPGIYLISHIVSGSVYVGQSVLIRIRLGQHHEMLTLRAHHNRGLQHLWNSHPPDTFSASVYLLCPEGLSPLERQWWLLKAERQAIQELRKEKNVLNEAEPEFVETPDALLELERKREAKDKVETKRVRSERRAIK